MSFQKILKRVWACGLAAVLAAALPETCAFAESAPEEGAADVISVTDVNPIYEDVLSEEDLIYSSSPDEIPLVAAPSSSDAVCTTIEEAAAIVREGMKARQTDIAFAYETYTEPDEQLLADIASEAKKHTGEPTEGDYLAFQCGGYTARASKQKYANQKYRLNVVYRYTYYTTKEQEEAVSAAAAQITGSLSGLSDYMKIKTIYNYIVSNVDYDYANKDNDAYLLKHTAYAALINRAAVCQGYAALFYRLLLEAGIDSRIVTGTGSGEAHGWNIVKLDGLYYNCDCTWDAGFSEGSWNYFLRGKNDFSDHTFDSAFLTESFLGAYPMAGIRYVETTASSTPTPVTYAVEEGEYYLVSALSSNAVLDIAGGSGANGANAQLYKLNKTEAQRFRVSHNDDGTVTLACVKSGKVLDAKGAGKTNGTNVQQYASNGTKAQKWEVASVGNGYYTIRASYCNLVFDVKGGSSKNGTNVQLYASNGSRAQRWKFLSVEEADSVNPLSEGDYVIASAISGSAVIDIAGGSSQNGANARLYRANGTRAQTFHLSWNSDGTASLTCAKSGKVLDAKGAGKSNGTNVQQYAPNGSGAQKWEIVPDGNGYYTIKASYCGLVFDAKGGSSKNGTNVWLYASNGTRAQKWSFIAA
ncbi:MAG: RICIN domain-containing protein [Lachnospiraceae bacterium]|nr:RICIN domain-containing protein [Lachnospiraceae bacterium]